MVPLAASTRRADDGTLCVENVHHGIVVAVSGAGARVAGAGDATRAFPVRSTIKPFQLLPYLLDGLHRGAAGETLADVAVMMASHGGEPMHTARVAALLERHGLSPAQLLCGSHPPLDGDARRALVRAGEQPTTLHCNCSGKHAGMLAVCARRGWPLDTYVEPRHPLQRRIHDLLAVLALPAPEPLHHAVDGCSLPTWILTLEQLARAFARLAHPTGAPATEGRPPRAQLETLFKAATTHPELVGGSSALDTRLMQAFAGSVLAKAGAAGLQALAVRPDARHPGGLGIAIKVADPDPGSRVRGVVALEALRQLGIEPATDERVLDPEVKTLRGETVGSLGAVFALG